MFDEIQVKELDQVNIYSVIIIDAVKPDYRRQVVLVYDKSSKDLKVV